MNYCNRFERRYLLQLTMNNAVTSINVITLNVGCKMSIRYQRTVTSKIDNIEKSITGIVYLISLIVGLK